MQDDLSQVRESLTPKQADADRYQDRESGSGTNEQREQTELYAGRAAPGRQPPPLCRASCLLRRAPAATSVPARFGVAQHRPRSRLSGEQ